MIPDSILQTLLSDLVTAVAYAMRGEWSSGYNLLLSGLAAAQAKLSEGAPWAGELIQRYQQVLGAFEERYGVKLT
jgi:hypothetical protein